MKATHITRQVIGNIVALKEGVSSDFEVGNVYPLNGRAAVRFERINSDGVRVNRNFTVFTRIPFEF